MLVSGSVDDCDDAYAYYYREKKILNLYQSPLEILGPANKKTLKIHQNFVFFSQESEFYGCSNPLFASSTTGRLIQ